MGFAETMAEARAAMGEQDHLIMDIDAIKEAMAREPLEGLQPGDVIRQKKLGDDYRSMRDDRPVVFVRYLSDAEKLHFSRRNDGNKITAFDILTASSVDKRDGELICYVENSTFYERA